MHSTKVRKNGKRATRGVVRGEKVQGTFYTHTHTQKQTSVKKALAQQQPKESS